MSPRQKSSKTVLYLLRNDLRVHDNECLSYVATLAAAEAKKNNGNGHHSDIRLLPLYCFQPEHYVQNGTHHFGFPKVGIFLGPPRTLLTLVILGIPNTAVVTLRRDSFS